MFLTIRINLIHHQGFADIDLQVAASDDDDPVVFVLVSPRHLKPFRTVAIICSFSVFRNSSCNIWIADPKRPILNRGLGLNGFESLCPLAGLVFH